MKRLIFSFLAISLLAFNANADQPGVHGMLLFGKQAVYASHLPMFHAPHDYQVLLRLTLSDLPRSETVALYQKTEADYFTLEPAAMDLAEVIGGTKTGFLANIYKGHFERGGQKLGPVLVHVEKVLFSSKLNAAPSDTSQNKYFVFGEAGEYFAAHLIQGKPNFDAILSMAQPFKLHVTTCRTRACSDPDTDSIPDSALPLNLVGPSSTDLKATYALGAFPGIMADIQKVVYVEEGDLSF